MCVPMSLSLSMSSSFLFIGYGGVVIVENEERKTRFVNRVMAGCDFNVDDIVLITQRNRQRMHIVSYSAMLRRET